jgi:opacity protein-like surface antigen
MEKLRRIIYGLILVIAFSTVTSAQLVQLGLGGGLTSITSPSQFNGSIESGGFNFNDNYHFTIGAKFNIPLAPIIPMAFLDYHILRGSGSVAGSARNTSLSILSFGAEGEYFFLPLPFIKPYLLADIAYNSFGQLQYNIGSDSTFIQLSHTNFGVALGIGAEITILPKIDFDVSAKYNLFNLTARQSGEEILRAFTLNVVMLF